MSFFKRLFGRKDSEKPKENQPLPYDTNLERQEYIDLGRSIFPLVRNKNESKFALPMPAGSELCTRPVAGDLLVVYVIDTAGEFQYINYGMIEKYRLSFEDLEKAGLRNLFDKTEGNLQIQAIQTSNENNPDGLPFFRIVLDGTYDVSLLAGDHFLEKMKDVAKDDAIAFAAPRKDVLLLSPVSNRMTLSQMGLTAGTLHINAVNDDNNTALSNQILIRRNGQWTAHENTAEEFYLKITEL